MFASQKIQRAKDSRILLSQLRRLLTQGQAPESFKKNSLAGHSSKSGPTAFPTILVFRTTNTQATGKSCFCLRWFITLASQARSSLQSSRHNFLHHIIGVSMWQGKFRRKRSPPAPHTNAITQKLQPKPSCAKVSGVDSKHSQLSKSLHSYNLFCVHKWFITSCGQTSSQPTEFLGTPGDAVYHLKNIFLAWIHPTVVMKKPTINLQIFFLVINMDIHWWSDDCCIGLISIYVLFCIQRCIGWISKWIWDIGARTWEGHPT